MQENTGTDEIVDEATRSIIILPGEYGLTTNSQPIGTFAVGAKNGCRGYCMIDPATRHATVAHIDFWELDEGVLDDMRALLGTSSQLRLGYTPNTRILPKVLSKFGINNCFTITSPQFLYIPDLDNLDVSPLPSPLMRSVFEDRKDKLMQRLKKTDKSLLLA